MQFPEVVKVKEAVAQQIDQYLIKKPELMAQGTEEGDLKA